MRRIPFFVPLVTMTLSAGLAFAQTTSGDLVGVVKDATGAAVPNAKVTAVNVETGVSQTINSGSAGEYRIGNLLPGTYNVSVASAGFQSYTLRGVAIDLNKTVTENIALAVGTSQSVEVVADAGAVLDTTSTNLATSFGNAELSALPITSTGLGVLNASLLSPGVASTGGIGIGAGPSVGGQRPRNNNFTIEGIDNNNKAVTGPLVYLPNDAVDSFTLITNQFSPEFGHSSGGQFNTTVTSGTNHFHGKLYEYFGNRNLDASSGVAGGKVANPRYDFNRYGAQLGGPIFRDRLFIFANFERQTLGQTTQSNLCVPTVAGLASVGALQTTYGLSATNVQQYLKYTPAATITGAGGAGIDAANDNACGNQKAGAQFLTLSQGTTYTSATKLYASGASTNIPLGNFSVNQATFSNFDALTTSADYTISGKDSLRLRYLYNTLGAQDTTASLPIFFTTTPSKFHLASLSEFHTFTPNLTNEVRIGYNRYANALSSGNFAYPGVDQFPNLTFFDQGAINIGPDGNAPQFTIQNEYQVVDNVSYVRGKHSMKVGFDGRKYISPQGFTQRARGDYQYNALTEFLHDLTPTSFGERSTGSLTYYGDQTALYGYFNDTYRATSRLTFNAGVRYEFTSVPVGERSQQLNSAATVVGLLDIHAPKPAYKNFAPRIGINYAPDSKTSIRAAFGMAYDVLFDNLGTLSFPPQYSSTNDVGTGANKNPGDPNFLSAGGLPAGAGGLATFSSIAAQQAATSAFLPDQVTPYAESYTLTVQRTIGANFTLEMGYIGTRGIHLPIQDQINVQPRVTDANQLPTSFAAAPQIISTPLNASTLASIKALPNIIPRFTSGHNTIKDPITGLLTVSASPNFIRKITSYQPFASSNYNAGILNLTRRFQNGLQANLSYTYSRTMDDATAEVFATSLTPRRPKNSQNIAQDYSRSALDRTHRLSLEILYDLPLYKHSDNFIKKNILGNWEISPVYIYESPEYATVLSGVNSNLSGDSGTYIGGALFNPNGKRDGSGSGVLPQYSASLASNCAAGSPLINSTATCSANLVGYIASDPTAQYVQAALGTLPNTARNSLATRPIDNLDMSAFKKFTFFDRYTFDFGIQAFNVLNHAQYIPGSVDNVNVISNTSTTPLQTVTNAFFNHPEKVFTNNARTMQLSGKISF